MTNSYAINHETFFNHSLAKFFRLGSSASLGALVTGMLLFLMCSLIAMDPPEIEIENIKITEVVMNDDRDIDPIAEPITEKPVDPAPEPKMPEFNQSFDTNETIEIVIGPPTTGGDLGIQLGNGSGAAMAIVKVAPYYPRRLQSRGIEGFVDLMFDITPSGKTENIRVVYSQPEGAFDHSAIKALAKWKYKPAMDDGVAMAQKNQTTRITYELEQ